METNLVLQSFGKENEYRRAVLTILSFYGHYKGTIDQTKVLLFTDNPEWFVSYFEGLPVQFILLSPEKIKTMRGEINFLHRMKIALIEEAFQLTKGNILYADSDTFFIDDPSPLIKQLSPDKSFMHLWEYEFEEMKNMELPAGKTFRDFLALIQNQVFKLADGRDIRISPKQASWNAGVMFFHPSHAHFIPDVYALTAQFYPSTQNHASEQYAFSILLQLNTRIESCENVIYHYWYRIKKQITDEFLQEKFTESWALVPLNKKISIVQQMTAILPGYFKSHILTYRDNAVQAFNNNKFMEGYKWALKSLIRKNNTAFLRDILYHTKRFISNKGINNY